MSIDKHIEAAAAALYCVISPCRTETLWGDVPAITRPYYVEAAQAAITAYHASLASAGDEGLVRTALLAFIEAADAPDQCAEDGVKAVIAVARAADALRLAEDTARLDWLESRSNGDKWVARESVTGRGYRLHNSAHEGRDTVRDAIDAARETEGGGHE